MFMCYILTYFILSYYHIPIILHCYLEYIRLILPNRSNRFLYLKKRREKKKKKLPGRKEWLPTPIFLPGKSHGHRSLAGSMGLQKVRHDLATNTNTLALSVDFLVPSHPLGNGLILHCFV